MHLIAKSEQSTFERFGTEKWRQKYSPDQTQTATIATIYFSRPSRQLSDCSQISTLHGSQIKIAWNHTWRLHKKLKIICNYY